jgi:hypothetical protein
MLVSRRLDGRTGQTVVIRWEARRAAPAALPMPRHAAAAHTDESDRTSRERETVMAEDENREHESLAAEAWILDGALEKAQAPLDRDAVAIAEEVQRFLRDRFLAHARADEERRLQLASRDHRRPEGRGGEPEVEMMAVRLDDNHRALAEGDFSDCVRMLLETHLRELRPFLHAHLGSTPSSEPPSTAPAEGGSRKG